MKKNIKYYTKGVRLSEDDYSVLLEINKHYGGMATFSDIVRSALSVYLKYLKLGGAKNEEITG